MKFNKRKRSGFTLIEIIIVVCIVGLLAAVAVVNFLPARDRAQLNSIVGNLRQVENAKDEWALINKKGTGATPGPTDIQPFLKNDTFPPASVVGETYNINAVGIPSDAITPVKLGTYLANGTISIP